MSALWDETAMRTIPVKWELLGAQRSFPKRQWEQLEIRESACGDFMEMIYRDRIPKLDGEQLLVPADWWQHAKRDLAPAWFKRRWPVRYMIYQAVRYLEGLQFPNPRDTHILIYDRFQKQEEDAHGCSGC